MTESDQDIFFGEKHPRRGREQNRAYQVSCLLKDLDKPSQ